MYIVSLEYELDTVVLCKASLHRALETAADLLLLNAVRSSPTLMIKVKDYDGTVLVNIRC